MTGAPTIVLSSGGTGGHLFPAESLAAVLVARGYLVTLVTDARGTGFAEGGIPRFQLNLRRSGRSPIRKLSSLFSILTGTFRSMGYLRSVSPALVVGFGGYPSVPAVLAAQLMGIPTLLQEQNTVPGRANKALAFMADAIATSFPHVEGLDAEKTVYVGHPVRPAFEELRNRDYTPPGGDEPIRLLVTGGSQGTSVFARIVPAAIALLPEHLRKRLRVQQQCRAEDIEQVTAQYRESGIEAETLPFFANLPERLGQAHFALGRSGASTVIETAMAGIPALYVPLPHSLTGEQETNAWVMELAGAAIMVKQDAFTPEYLATRLEALLTDPERLCQMSHAARGIGRPNATSNIADLIADLIEARPLPAREAA